MSHRKLIRMLILATAMCATTVLSASFGSTLYDTSDPVQILHSENFHKELRKTPKAYLVQFYNSWCGHCIRFAPTFKTFAAGVRGWNNVVGVGVINCADAANGPTCRDQYVTGYPTLKLFWIQPGGKGSTNGEALSSREPDDIQKEIITFIENKVKDHGSPPHWPNLEPSRAKDLKEIWSGVPASAKQVFAVVEEPGSFAGRELILDFSFTDLVSVVRFLRGRGPEELRNQDAVSLVLLERGLHPRVLITEKDPTKARARFKQHLKTLGYDFGEGIAPKTTTEGPHAAIGNYSKVYMDDIEAGIAYSLRQEVGLKSEITAQQMSVLKSFIQLIYENIDLPPRIKNYLEALQRKMHVRGTLRGSDFPKLLKIAEDRDSYLSKDVDFVGCRGSLPGKRGYTCALWTIFHYINVGSHGRFLAKKIDNPNLAMLVIRDYILNFFSCTDCVNHFREMSANLESELTNPNESVLWLWRGHNKVNARLRGDMTEDPQRPKVQFPPKGLCKECYVGDAFNEFEVLRFLHRFYSKENLVQSERTPTTTVVERYTDTASGKYFSGFDLTIFLVIYAVSITLLFLVFVAMVCRRRKGNFNKNFSFLH